MQKNVGDRERHWQTTEGIIQYFVGDRKRELRDIENLKHISNFTTTIDYNKEIRQYVYRIRSFLKVAYGFA